MIKEYKTGRFEGVIKFSNGNRYEGDLVQGKMHGYGTYICANGKVYKGKWQNDKFIG